jgi:hypothetical protein
MQAERKFVIFAILPSDKLALSLIIMRLSLFLSLHTIAMMMMMMMMMNFPHFLIREEKFV